MSLSTIADPLVAVPKPLPLPAASKSFLDALPTRRSIYALSSDSAISDTELEAIVQHSILHVPSTFNVQSGRVLLLLGTHHKKLWNIAADAVKPTQSEQGWAMFKQKIDEYRGAYGSVLFFEDPTAFEDTRKMLGEQRWTMVKGQCPVWSEHSSGMLQFAVWTAFAACGLGCNLQHYQMFFGKQAAAEWNIPETWELKAQLVFGTPTGPPRAQKTFKSVDERVVVKKG